MYVCVYVCNGTSMNSAYNEKYFKKSCRENRNKHCIHNKCFPESRDVYEIMWKNVAEADTISWTHALCMLDD